MDILILFSSLLFLMLIGVPVTFSMGMAAVFFLIVTDQFNFAVMLPLRMVVGLEHYGLMAIPMFYFAGAVMTAGGADGAASRFRPGYRRPRARKPVESEYRRKHVFRGRFRILHG